MKSEIISTVLVSTLGISAIVYVGVSSSRNKVKLYKVVNDNAKNIELLLERIEKLEQVKPTEDQLPPPRNKRERR